MKNSIGEIKVNQGRRTQRRWTYLNTFTFLFGVGILEFAGLAFLFFALAKKLNGRMVCSLSSYRLLHLQQRCS